jgi:SprT-like family
MKKLRPGITSSSSRDPFYPFFRRSCKRDASLEQTFNSFNAAYFQSKLPRYGVFVCTRSKNFAHVGAGYCSTNEQNIFLRAGMSRNATLQTLAHEMVHAKLSRVKKNVHGKLFVKNLRRIRKLGAPLSSSEPDMAEGNDFFRPRKLNRRNVENAIRVALLSENVPERYVSKFLEREFFLPFSVISKVANVREMISRINSKQST